MDLECVASDGCWVPGTALGLMSFVNYCFTGVKFVDSINFRIPILFNSGLEILKALDSCRDGVNGYQFLYFSSEISCNAVALERSCLFVNRSLVHCESVTW